MPVQCPECARFLSNAFVAGLQKGPAPCPKCETSLRAEQFADGAGQASPTPVTTDPEEDAESVRPPDLPATAVRDDAVSDPLDGWDRPDNVVPIGSARHHRDPTALGAAIGIGAAVGALVGALVDDRSVRGAVLGGSLGAAAGAATAQAVARRNQVDLIE